MIERKKISWTKFPSAKRKRIDSFLNRMMMINGSLSAHQAIMILAELRRASPNRDQINKILLCGWCDAPIQQDS